MGKTETLDERVCSLSVFALLESHKPEAAQRIGNDRRVPHIVNQCQRLLVKVRSQTEVALKTGQDSFLAQTNTDTPFIAHFTGKPNGLFHMFSGVSVCHLAHSDD